MAWSRAASKAGLNVVDEELHPAGEDPRRLGLRPDREVRPRTGRGVEVPEGRVEALPVHHVLAGAKPSTPSSTFWSRSSFQPAATQASYQARSEARQLRGSPGPIPRRETLIGPLRPGLRRSSPKSRSVSTRLRNGRQASQPQLLHPGSRSQCSKSTFRFSPRFHTWVCGSREWFKDELSR